MLLRNLGSQDGSGQLLTELGDGLPTIAALARLCGRSISGDVEGIEPSSEALALVVVARDSGVFEIRGDKDAFESADRLLAVCVEVAQSRKLLFRDKSNPRNTMIFFDAFRELCQSGLVVHHLLKEFSLSKSGFELASRLKAEDYSDLLSMAVELEH